MKLFTIEEHSVNMPNTIYVGLLSDRANDECPPDINICAIYLNYKYLVRLCVFISMYIMQI